MVLAFLLLPGKTRDELKSQPGGKGPSSKASKAINTHPQLKEVHLTCLSVASQNWIELFITCQSTGSH